MDKNKDESIETIRGIALLLMVMGHVIGENAFEGMRLSDQSFGRYLYVALIHLRMPLFTVISGYVYSIRPVDKNTKLSYFYNGKARRLLLPLISIGTIQFLLQCYIPGVNSVQNITSIWKIYFFPYSRFWFLQAMFLIFVLVSFIDFYGIMKSRLNWIFLFLISCIIYMFNPFGNFFSLNRAFYLLPFFIIGCGLKRFEGQWIANKKLKEFLFVVLFLGMLIHHLNYFNLVEISNGRYGLLALINGICSTFLFVLFRFKSKILSKIGYYSYSIYLLHLFGSASSRMMLKGIQTSSNDLVIFVISFSMGIFIPIIMELVIIRRRWSGLIFLGYNHRKFK